MVNAQDKALQDALSTLANEAEAPRPEAPTRVTTRRTVIEGQVMAPLTGYRVSIAGTDIDVDASDFGDAVVKALTLKSTPPEFGGYVFLFRYSVTDSTGITLDGGERLMREYLEQARMRGK